MYAGREIFPNPPLEYVAAEIRFPYAPRLHQQDVRDAILIEMEDLFPILRPQSQVTMTGVVGGPVSQQLDQVQRAFNRTSTAAMGLTTNTLTVDTTSYKEFTPFRDIVRRCLLALDKHAAPAAIERVGLRYVNEIRVPDLVEDVRDWHGWIADGLVAAATAIPDHRAAVMQGIVQYETIDNRNLTLRFLSGRAGSVIGSEPLKRRHPAVDGPFFVLDLDSFWQPGTDASPDWSVDTVMEAIELLHAPIGSAFQAMITDKLREAVLRRIDGS